MEATDILSQEHRVIEQVLDCLEAHVRQSEEAGKVDAPTTERILDFLRNFADGCHHAKEENHLFPWMERHGFSRQYGPTGVMFREHTLGRHYLQQLSKALPGASRGLPGDVQAFAEAARSYLQLLREHIHKEDHCLFTMAAQVATPADDRELLDAYARTETADIGEGVHEKYLVLADKLALQLGVEPRAAFLAAKHCGCGHAH